MTNSVTSPVPAENDILHSNKASEKRRSVPGVREIALQIRGLNDQIQKIEDDMKFCQKRISDIVRKEKESSPRQKFILRISEESDKLRSLRAEKKAHFDEIDLIKNKIDNLHKAGCRYDSTTVEDIDESIEKLNRKLIVEKVTPKEEKGIAAELLALKIKKNKLGESQENVRILKTLEATMKETKQKIAALSTPIDTHQKAISELKAELDKLMALSKTKSNPEVSSLESRIESLKSQRQVLLDQKTGKKEVIHSMELEYQKLEQAILLQKQLEDDKDSIRAEISQLRKDIDRLLKEQSEFDSKIFDSLVFTVSSLIKSKRFNLNIDLVNILLKHGISLPRDVRSAEAVIEELKKKKINFEKDCVVKNKQIAVSISEINNTISSLMSKLSEMPETDFELLKKGGFRRINKE